LQAAREESDAVDAVWRKLTHDPHKQK